MATDAPVTVDSLIRDELAGKAAAISQYDNMLWKIRSGYAVILYASIGIIAGLVNEKNIDLNLTTATAAGVIIVGFSAFAAVLDYSFMRSKLRVVAYRDRLTEIAYRRATEDSIGQEDENQLLDCLKNSGERKESVDWNRWTGFARPLILYGGTSLVGVLVAAILAN